MQTQKIGQLKNDLLTKGYTHFNINDLEEFKTDYEYFKKYICNENSNLKEKIKAIRLNGAFKLKDDTTPVELIHLQKAFESNKEVIEYTNDFFQKNENNIAMLSQYWYYGEDNSVLDNFKKLFTKMVNIFYNETGEYQISHNTQITYYDKNCFLQKHEDGLVDGRICAILFYLNEDYKIENGGNLILDDKETILPIYGNVAMIDFTQGNVSHEVTKVVDGIGRYAVLAFSNTQNKKYIVK